MKKFYTNQQGFSLVELSVVLAVMSVMAVAAVPTLVTQTQSKLVEKASEDVNSIMDAARWFRVKNEDNLWPGQDTDGGCDFDSNSGNDDTLAFYSDLGDILRPIPKDPWSSNEYEIAFEENGGQCQIIITTPDQEATRTALSRVKGHYQNSLPVTEAMEDSGGNFSGIMQTTLMPPGSEAVVEAAAGVGSSRIKVIYKNKHNPKACGGIGNSHHVLKEIYLDGILIGSIPGCCKDTKGTSCNETYYDQYRQELGKCSKPEHTDIASCENNGGTWTN